ncbi:hypothetical protein [Sorangium sp. So ce381]|uniref:hypothetical protein n=1 Tax=Sorangium sp. So ce381 TaxID=3133307 RepID=UPI003F5B3C93
MLDRQGEAELVAHQKGDWLLDGILSTASLYKAIYDAQPARYLSKTADRLASEVRQTLNRKINEPDLQGENPIIVLIMWGAPNGTKKDPIIIPEPRAPRQSEALTLALNQVIAEREGVPSNGSSKTRDMDSCPRVQAELAESMPDWICSCKPIHSRAKIRPDSATSAPWAAAILLPRPSSIPYLYIPIASFIVALLYLLQQVFGIYHHLADRVRLLLRIDQTIELLRVPASEEELLNRLPEKIKGWEPWRPDACLVYIPTDERASTWRLRSGYGMDGIQEQLLGETIGDQSFPACTTEEPDHHLRARDTILTRSIRNRAQVSGEKQDIPEYFRSRGITNFIATPLLSADRRQVFAVVGTMSKPNAWSRPWSKNLEEELLRYECALFAITIEHCRVRNQQVDNMRRLAQESQWRHLSAGLSHQLKNLMLKASPSSLHTLRSRLPPDERWLLDMIFVNHRDINRRIEWLSQVSGLRVSEATVVSCDLVDDVIVPALVNGSLYHICSSTSSRPLIGSSDDRNLSRLFSAVKMLANGAHRIDDHELLSRIDEGLGSLRQHMAVTSLYRALMQFVLRATSLHITDSDPGYQNIHELLYASDFEPPYRGPAHVQGRFCRELLQGCFEELIINALAAMARSYATDPDRNVAFFQLTVSSSKDTKVQVEFANSGGPIPLDTLTRQAETLTGDSSYLATGVGLLSTRYFLEKYYGASCLTMTRDETRGINLIRVLIPSGAEAIS